MDDVPSTLSALARAQKLQKRAGGVGFDFETLQAISLKLTEELDELSGAIELGATQEIESELGDVLFTVVNMARHLKVDSEAALRKANRRFETRVRTAEGDALADGSRLDEENIQRLDARWQEVKRKERSR
jgi:uncharacterized protein YabN with tetrapyrrole methylase and pyrophosphatase domain